MKNKTPLETIQLFPDNVNIPSIHHYVENQFGINDVFFTVELSEKELNNL